MRICLLNGPPRCGKDTAARQLVPSCSAPLVMKFSDILKDRTHKLYGLTCDINFFEDMKDDRRPEFYGLAPRQAYIEVSERYFKMVHGGDFFGRVMAQQLRPLKHDGNLYQVLVPDSGFITETIPLIEEFGEDNVILVRIHRQGRTFNSDSRNYLDIAGIRSIDVRNDGTILEFSGALNQEVLPWLRG